MNQTNHYYLCGQCKGRAISQYHCAVCYYNKNRSNWPATFCSNECVDEHEKVEHLSVNLT